LQTKNDRIFEKASSTLSGANGIVYLLFVGRENYAAKIQGLMTDALFAHESNVNQTVSKLTKAGKRFLVFKNKYREKGNPGRARDIYTANLNPIIATLTQFNIRFNESELTSVLTDLAETADYFPKYLTNMFQKFLIRKLHWHQLLSLFFLYLSEVLKHNDIIVYPIPSDIQVNRDKLKQVLERNPSVIVQLDSLGLQLNSPELGLNPLFLAYLRKAREDLGKVDSEATKFIQFLRAIEKEGISDFSVFTAQVRQVMEIYEKRDELWSKLKAVESKLEETNTKNVSS
jgi:hypothetical protein